MKRFLFSAVCSLMLTVCCIAQKTNIKNVDDRKIWLSYLDKLARPVLSNMAANTLKQNMPVVLSERIDNKESRTKASYLEAFGRTLAGIAPWLNGEGGDKEEIALREQYRKWTLSALANSVNPQAKDYLLWTGGQPLVDASFVAIGLVRCPWLWENSDSTTKRQVQEALLSSRSTVPPYTNWLLFSGMIEAFFCKYNLPFDKLRIDFGVKEFTEHWYTGDGQFSDGNQFHWDYYNSYVIQPYLNSIVEITNMKYGAYKNVLDRLDKITKRYAAIQERLINADGSFPIIGRSIIYRGGAFQHLADMALRKKLPAEISPAQVRGALTAVIKKTTESPATFNSAGWLNIGMYGSQPGLADWYINTGSLYLCSTVLLPLGLSPDDDFWKTPAQPWTAVKVWSGADLPADHALEVK